jgi:hypothetical protein
VIEAKLLKVTSGHVPREGVRASYRSLEMMFFKTVPLLFSMHYVVVPLDSDHEIRNGSRRSGLKTEDLV